MRFYTLLAFLGLLWIGATPLSAQVTMTIADTTVTPGDHFCLDVTTRDFNDISNFQFTLRWDTSSLRLDSIAAINLPFKALFFTNLGVAWQGFVPVIWNADIPIGSTEGVFMPDDTSLFKICLTATGDFGMDTVKISDTPLNIEISTVTAGGQNIGLNTSGGKVNIVAPYDLSDVTVNDVDCDTPDGGVTINPQGAVPDYSYDWSGPSGFTSNTKDITTSVPGTYTLIISDASTPPLVRSFDFIVNGDFEAPNASVINTAFLGCRDDVRLDGTASSVGVNFTYNWTTIDGNIVGGANTLAPLVNRAGNYVLTVRNTDNGCESVANAVVSINNELPTVEATIDEMLDCINTSITIDGSNSSQGNEFEYLWTTVDGNIVGNNRDLEVNVDAPGTYTLNIQNNLTGCANSEDFIVTGDTVAPLALIGQEFMLNCQTENLEITLDFDTLLPQFQFLWTTTNGNILEGETTATPSVNAAGTYTLSLTNQANGCSFEIDVEVEKDANIPDVAAGEDTIVTCILPEIILNGAGSATGNSITYLWTTNDGNIIDGEESLEPLIDQPGTYTLIVTDTNNLCAATASVEVANGYPPDADAGNSFSICTPERIELIANLPDGQTGFWTALDGALIEDSMLDTTAATGLISGFNYFTWTLSTAECPEYSIDSLLVIVETTPTANDDAYQGPLAPAEIPLDVVSNDDVLTVGQWDIKLLTSPELGVVSVQGGGVITYDYPSNAFGIQQFQYELCSSICPQYCDTANVSIDIAENVDTTVQLANAITPNGDGVNEFFVVPQLKANPDLYPQNELVIFNRWGDIVYEARPYFNDWGGQTNQGKELPQGTYYYVLRLNVSEGIIFKGDITILK